MEQRREFLALLVLALINAGLMFLLSTQHTFASMWVESYAFERIDDYLRFLSLSSQNNYCWVHIGERSFPLGYNSYMGVIPYSYLPSVSLWLNGLVTDPFVYRYYGILLLAALSFLFYGILRLLFSRSNALLGSIILITTPTLFLTTLTDWQNLWLPISLLLLALFFAVLAARRHSAFLLSLAAFFSGAVLLGRFEMLIWPCAAAAIYLLWVRPPFLTAWLTRFRRRPSLAILILTCFVLGALPTIVYQTTCPYNVVYQLSSWSREGKITTSASPMTQKMVTRVQQMWDYNLLARNPEYLMLTPNWLLALACLTAVTGLIVKSVQDRKPDLLALLILVSIPLSTFTSGDLRLEHITFLQVFFVLALLSGLNWWKQKGSLSVPVIPILVLVIVGNVWTTYLDWQIWTSTPATEQTALNQSDPVLLMDYLSQHHPHDRLLYTNIGLYQYAQYLSRGRLPNEDFTGWDGDEMFRRRVIGALTDDNHKRVFVAVGRERDGMVGTLRRTRLLYAILDQYQVPYTVTRLPSPRNPYAYEIITVDRGVQLASGQSAEMLLSDVTDVRIEGDQVIGSAIGMGFQPTDSIQINNQHIVSSYYGHSRWMTFKFPVALLGGRDTFSVQILRLSKLEATATINVTLSR